MKTLITMMLTIFVFVPPILLVVFTILFRKMGVKPNRAFGYAADIATFLVLIVDYLLLQGVWSGASWATMPIVVIFIAMLTVFHLWRTSDEIRFLRLVKLVWRNCFVVFHIIYIVLLIMGWGKGILSAFS
ncbi:MAG: DUF3397 family protein [Bacilli bacterium]